MLRTADAKGHYYYYYPVNSVLHRLDPRVKLIGTVIFLISLFFKNTCYSFYLLADFLR